MASTFERAMAYLQTMDPAVSGAGGHNQTLRAACECVRFGLCEAEAWQALQWWNDHRCQPAWTERELRHKLASAYKIATPRAGVRVAGSATSRRGPGRARQWVAPPAPRAARSAVAVPVRQRSEAEEEAWWSQVAAARGFDSLAAFDAHCGLVSATLEQEEFVHG
jgi:hypothetical protein